MLEFWENGNLENWTFENWNFENYENEDGNWEFEENGKLEIGIKNANRIAKRINGIKAADSLIAYLLLFW